MRRTILISAVAASVGLVGCQKDQSGLESKLADIDKRLESIEAAVKQGRAGAAAPRARQRRRGPDPKEVYSVPVADAPFKGNPDAKVTVVKAFEFACPYCQKVRPTLDQLLADYGDDIRVVYKHYVVHPQVATVPARAACAAHQQGKFGEMEELIWTKGYNAGRNLGQDNMEKLAGELGLDVAKFKADMAGKCTQVVQKDQSELAAVGSRSTPGFFINGRHLAGARPIQQFKAVIDEELAKANDRIAKGTPAARYYDKWVVEKGVKRFVAK